MWDFIDKFFFGTVRPLRQLHMPKRVKLIESGGELMNYASFQGRSFLMKYETCSPQG
jgi:hypothetical protein